jgi:hypothetical protein
VGSKFFFILLLVCCLTAHTFLFCNHYDQENIDNTADIVYIEPWQILVLPEGLFVDIEGHLYPTDWVGYGENGYFVYHAGWWKCKNGHYNAPWITVCPLCGERRPR